MRGKKDLFYRVAQLRASEETPTVRGMRKNGTVAGSQSSQGVKLASATTSQ